MRGEGRGDPQNNFSDLLVIILRWLVIILRWFYCFFQSYITIFHHLKIILGNILRWLELFGSISGTTSKYFLSTRRKLFWVGGYLGGKLFCRVLVFL